MRVILNFTARFMLKLYTCTNRKQKLEHVTKEDNFINFRLLTDQ